MSSLIRQLELRRKSIALVRTIARAVFQGSGYTPEMLVAQIVVICDDTRFLDDERVTPVGDIHYVQTVLLFDCPRKLRSCQTGNTGGIEIEIAIIILSRGQAATISSCILRLEDTRGLTGKRIIILVVPLIFETIRCN